MISIISPAAEEHPGEWKTFAAGGESFRLLLRPLPEAEMEKLRDRYRTRNAVRRLGGTRLGRKKDDQEKALGQLDRRLTDFNRARASYSLLDSEGLEISMAGPATAVAYGALVGEVLTVGAVVKIDGRLGNTALKERLLSDWPGNALAIEINRQADSIASIEATEEAELEEEAAGN